MGYLLNAWKETQKKFTMSLRQSVSIAGDGLLDNEESVNELREFYQLIDLNTMERFLSEASSKDKKTKFDARAFAFQDLINEIGRRLGYHVQHGLYHGKKNDIGFDGLWKSDDGDYIVMEAKTSDDYSISMESVIGYRDKLIVEHRIPKKKCSILIVYGRDDKGGLRNSVKGSDESKIIRLISANALFQLVKIYTESKSDVVARQINSMLRPKDFFVLDNLVELVFPQTDEEIQDIPQDEEEEEPTRGETISDETDDEKEDKKDNNKYSIFDGDTPDDELIFHLISNALSAKGFDDGDGFVVLKGADVSDHETPSCPNGIREMRKALRENGMVKGNKLAVSVKFNSTSMAAAILRGGAAAGPKSWKNRDGVLYKMAKHTQS